MRNVYLMILNLHLGALELGREARQKLVVQIIHGSLGLGLLVKNSTPCPWVFPLARHAS